MNRSLRMELAGLLTRRGQRREALTLYDTLATEFRTDGDLTNAFAAYQAMLQIDPNGQAARWGRREAIRRATSDLRAQADEPSVTAAERVLREAETPSPEVADAVFSALAHASSLPSSRLQTLAQRVAGSELMESLAATLVEAGRSADASVVFQAMAAAYAETGDDDRHRAALDGLRATDTSDLGSRRRTER